MSRALGLVGALTVCEGALAAQRLRVVSQPEFLIDEVVREEESVRISGLLLDDARAPVGDARIGVYAPGTRVRSCSGEPRRPTTDAEGRYCVEIEPGAEESVVLQFEGRGPWLAAHRHVPLQPTPPSTNLQFRDPTLVVFAGGGPQVVSLLTSGAGAGEVGLALRLNGRSHTLGAQALAAGEGELDFSFDLSDLGEVGPGRFVARVEPGQATGGAEAQAVALVSARVHLEVLSTERRGDERIVSVRATAPVAATPKGDVALFHGERLLDRRPLTDGAAALRAPRPVAESAEEPFTIVFLPEDPWWVPEREAEVVPQTPPARSGPWPWLVALAFAGYAWLPAARKKPPGAPARETRKPARPLAARASVVASPSGEPGWRGRVIDAHDAAPIAGAQLCFELPSGAELRVETSADGSFRAQVDEAPPSIVTLTVRAPHRSRHRTAVPPTGRLTIHLPTRRRELLDRLSEWAAHRKPIWKTLPKEPTPAQLRSAATGRGASNVAQWAGAVEAAAYGAVEPSEQATRSLLEALPSLDAHEQAPPNR